MINAYETLEDLFLLKIKALYDIETKLTKALPKMVKNSTNAELKSGFRGQLKETQGHVNRLVQIFKLLGKKPAKTDVEAIDGLIADAQWLMKNVKDKQALDAALIAAAQYIEHYEIAGYGTAKEWARLLGLRETVKLLEQTLAEEEKGDKVLNALAVFKVNEAAMF